METITLLATITVAFITAVLGPVMVIWVKSYLESKGKSHIFNETLELGKLIDEQLELLIDELECDGVWITQFHNGGHFYPTGKSIQKFSIFYEKLTPNIDSIQTTFQNIPVSLFPKALSLTYEKGEISMFSSQEEKNDLDSFLKSCNSGAVYMIALNDLQDKFIGTLIFLYKQEYKLKKEEWILVRQKAGVIGTLLDKFLYKKK
jgi:hypothetical protein